MDWATFQTALRAWAAGQTGLTTIWADQNAPRPAYPFVVLNVIAESQQGVDETRYALNEDDEILEPEIVGLRQFTLSIRVFTASQAAGLAGRSYLSTLRASLQKASVLAAFQAAGLAVVRALPSQTVDEAVDGRWYSVGLMDVQFAAAESQADSETNYIETVEATGTFPPSDLTITGPYGVGE